MSALSKLKTLLEKLIPVGHTIIKTASNAGTRGMQRLRQLAIKLLKTNPSLDAAEVKLFGDGIATHS